MIVGKNRDFLINDRVTYTLELDGKLYSIENVPAAVDKLNEEYFFSSSTVKNLQQIILSEPADNSIETAVYQYLEVS